jgi:hypothetical protein
MVVRGIASRSAISSMVRTRSTRIWIAFSRM